MVIDAGRLDVPKRPLPADCIIVLIKNKYIYFKLLPKVRQGTTLELIELQQIVVGVGKLRRSKCLPVQGYVDRLVR